MNRDRKLADVREQHGFTPWYFNLPDKNKGYEAAWSQLMDPQGFHAPYGPTTAEQRHPRFQISYKGHECQWNGPSWPLSTSITLTGLANVLNNYPQNVIGRQRRQGLQPLDLQRPDHHRPGRAAAARRRRGRSQPAATRREMGFFLPGQCVIPRAQTNDHLGQDRPKIRSRPGLEFVCRWTGIAAAPALSRITGQLK